MDIKDSILSIPYGEIKEPIIVKRKNKKDVVIISFEEYKKKILETDIIEKLKFQCLASLCSQGVLFLPCGIDGQKKQCSKPSQTS